ncbi:MAG: hypothetical protein WEB87_04715 [Bacteriovoracaceae bacterium]
MSEGLKIEVERKPSEVEVVFEGQIDEDADFSSLSGLEAQVMVFNLEKVSLINSCGIREWVEFQKKLPKETKLVYRKCPQVIVEQLNIVKGFIRDNSLIESFFAPYYNEARDQEVKVLLTPSQVKEGKAPVIKDEDGSELEFDEIEMQYFSFLKNG